MDYFWLASFWIISVIIVLPIPIRTYMYVTKKAVYPFNIVADEYIACIIAVFGLIGFYGYAYQVPIWHKEVWAVYLVVYIVYTFFALLFSPKLAYVTDLIGKKKQRLVLLGGVIITLPLPMSIYLYSSSAQL